MSFTINGELSFGRKKGYGKRKRRGCMILHLPSSSCL